MNKTKNKSTILILCSIITLLIFCIYLDYKISHKDLSSILAQNNMTLSCVEQINITIINPKWVKYCCVDYEINLTDKENEINKIQTKENQKGFYSIKICPDNEYIMINGKQLNHSCFNNDIQQTINITKCIKYEIISEVKQ